MSLVGGRMERLEQCMTGRESKLEVGETEGPLVDGHYEN